MRAAMIEKPCADATSIEEMVSQKSVSNLWMSAYPLQAKEWKRAGRVRLVRHGGSSDGGSIASKRSYREYNQVTVAYISMFHAPRISRTNVGGGIMKARSEPADESPLQLKPLAR